MKRVVTYIICAFQFGTGFSQYKTLVKAESEICSGFIYVEGRTNINQFEFASELSSLNLYDLPIDTSQWIDSFLIKIPIPVSEFNTRNPIMYKEFLELLKANQFPYIHIGINYPILRKIYQERENTVSPFEITLAGVTNDYMINCRVMDCTNDYVYIVGSKEIKLTDFNLKPPQKLQGLVKVNDYVLINFGLVFGMQENIKFISLESKHQD